MSPYSYLYGHFFDYSLLRTFGCICFVLLPSHEWDKLSSEIRTCIFIGYSFAHKGYQFYDFITKRLRFTRHVSFFENVSYYHSSHIHDLFFLDTTTSIIHPSHLLYPFSIPPLHDSLTKSSFSSVDVTTTDTLLLMITLTSPGEQPPPRRNQSRDHQSSVRCCASASTTYSLEFSSFFSILHSLQEPKSYFEVVKSPEWQHAMNEKLAAFQHTQT